MILVFGSLNADFFLPVKEFPLAGETVLTPESFIKAGGKGANQAVAAAKAGAKVSMIGAVGEDDISRVPVTALKSYGIDCTHLQMSQLSTGMAMIMVDSQAENSIIVASGANNAVLAERVPEEVLKEAEILVMQMEVPPEENFKLLKRAKQNNMKTILNVAPARIVTKEALEQVDYLIVNEIESRTIYASVFENKDEQDMRKILLALSDFTQGVCLVTLGKEGVLLADKGQLTSVSSLKITPVDTTGAGDAFVGLFASMLDRGFSLKEAVKRASAGAGLACLKMGAQEALPTFEEIEARMQEIEIREEFL